MDIFKLFRKNMRLPWNFFVPIIEQLKYLLFLTSN